MGLGSSRGHMDGLFVAEGCDTEVIIGFERFVGKEIEYEYSFISFILCGRF